MMDLATIRVRYFCRLPFNLNFRCYSFKRFAGITALAATEHGRIANPIPHQAFTDVSWNDLRETHQVVKDMLFCARADLLKAHPFPEVDLVIPESVVWSAIGHLLTRHIPEVLLIKEYQAVNAISFTGLMSYNRGRAYSLVSTERHLKNYPKTWKVRLLRLVKFIRYSIHGGLGLGEARRLWKDNSGSFVYWMTFPFAMALAFKDRLQKKVIKSHREFDAVKHSVILTVDELNSV